MRKDIILFIAITVMLYFACGCNESEHESMLLEMDSLMNSEPDSAFFKLSAMYGERYLMSEDESVLLDVLTVKAKNKAYILLDEKDEKTMRRAAEYYDEHGNRNERMMAYYLLGCVYRDLRDMPMAFDVFKKAEAAADTTSEECDFSLLAKINGELGDVFMKQVMFDNTITQNLKAKELALKGMDSVTAAKCEALILMAKLKKNNDYEYTIRNVGDVYERILQLKDTATASECLIMGVEANMKLGRWDDAKVHLRIYETKSGKIDGGFHALKGFEQYYYYKGLCMLNDGKTDSAKLFLDKRLKTARNWNAKQNAYKGLKYYYENMGMTDSALYYSNQQIMARDSDYYHKSNDNMQYLQSIYEYSHHKNTAMEKSVEIEKRKSHFFILLLCLVLSGMIFIMLFSRLKIKTKKVITVARRREAKLWDDIDKLKRKINSADFNLAKSVSEIEKLESELKWKEELLKEIRCKFNKKKKLEHVIENEKRELDDLKTEVVGMKNDLDIRKANLEREKKETEALRTKLMTALQDDGNYNAVIESIKNKGYSNENISSVEWDLIMKIIMKVHPSLISNLKANVHKITEVEIKVCALMVLGFTTNEIGMALSKSPSTITNIRCRLYTKAFNRKVSSKEADEWIRSLSR